MNTSKAAVITAIFSGLIALLSAGGLVYQQIHAGEAAERTRIGSGIQVQRLNLRTREALVNVNERLNEMAQAMNNAQIQIQALTTMRQKDALVGAEPGALATPTLSAMSGVLSDMGYRAQREVRMDDMLEQMPDTVAYPTDDEVDPYIGGDAD